MTLPPDISHERCSELHDALVRGRLSPLDRAAVERHLAGCPDCARELGAVRLLLGEPVEAMHDLERARLRTGILEGLHQGPPGADRDHDEAESLRPASRARLQPGAWLGAAAATVILFVAAVVYLGSGGPVGRGTDRAGEVESSRPSEGEGNAAARAPGVKDEGPITGPNMGPGPLVVRRRIRFTEESLGALGQTAPSFRAFARAYGTEDVSRLQDRFARVVRRGLAGVRIASCLDQAVAAHPGSLPAYGALGML
ncbi:MAG: zf-HC2 domain-containing protein, partial [Actinobacteria bacterium]|nr:zf-HC2 domain-containing protein [Actinomycetota bacterium]